MVATTKPNAFLQRARLEAERYGSDAWVFVRELLQNARDAGAHRVWFQTSIAERSERVSCRDDGAGMTFDHAHRYLFSLYASSKRGRRRSAGRFGIGFWSVLRFEPNEIVVRSQPQRGEGWQVRLDGRLEHMKREQTSMRPGTEVVLERRVSADDLENILTTSILRDAPWLRCRHRDERLLEVRVNGRLVRAEPALPPPSMSFRRRGLRGVVGLGSEPRAEIFAHGLRVRDAATLDELLVEARPQTPALAGATDGLAPRIIIDSRNLEVLMARGDAREDRALRRLVAVGQRELRRLVRRELDRYAAMSLPRRWAERLLEMFAFRPARIVFALVLTASVAWFALRGVSTRLSGPGSGSRAAPVAVSLETRSPAPYGDLSGRYLGPEVDGLGGVTPPVDLSYRPIDQEYLFAALWVQGLPIERVGAADLEVVGPYEGTSCTLGCLDVELGLEAAAGLLRLPIATGYMVDPETVRLNGRRVPVFEVAMGQPAVRLENSGAGRLSYRMGPGRSTVAAVTSAWPPLPDEFAEFVEDLDEMQAFDLASRVARFVARRIVYDASTRTAVRYRKAPDEPVRLFNRAAAIRAGDCDVQNSLVVAMLAAAGIPSRLAVGWVGSGGRARKGLHAWAEYLDENGIWRVADASAVRVRIPASTSGFNGVPEKLPRDRFWTLPWVITGIAALVVVAAVFSLISSRRWRRQFRAGDRDDIVDLVRGAAVRPRSFEEIHALFARRLLRLVSGRSVSLARAREMARKGRLACGRRRSELARRASRGGGFVLDLDHAESAAVADVLAAVNLDEWQDLIARAAGDELTTRVEDRLVAAGEARRILVADRPGSEMAVLDGTAFGLDSCWTVLDENGRLWQSIHRGAGRRPARVSLVLAETVVTQMGVPRVGRHRLLSGLALEALCEAAEVCRE
jgi:hypothetical protein